MENNNDLLLLRKKICGLHRLTLRIIEEIELERQKPNPNQQLIIEKQMKLEYVIVQLYNQIINGTIYTHPTPFQIEILGDEDWCMR